MRFPWFFVLFPAFLIFFHFIFSPSLFQSIALYFSYLLLLPLSPTIATPFTLTFPHISVEIIELCSARLEMIVLLSAILATDTRPWEKRFKYVFLFAPVVVLINAVRIATVVYLGTYMGWEIADLFHTILFKMSLFGCIAGLYYLFLRWSK